MFVQYLCIWVIFIVPPNLQTSWNTNSYLLAHLYRIFKTNSDSVCSYIIEHDARKFEEVRFKNEYPRLMMTQAGTEAPKLLLNSLNSLRKYEIVTHYRLEKFLIASFFHATRRAHQN